MDKLESMMLEAETVSALMIQMADDDVGDTSFAVMSDLGENGTEHECDLSIHETALRASSVIDQLLAELEDERASREQWQQNCTRAKERIAELEAQVKVWESAALKHLARAEEAEKRLPILEQDKLRLNEIINSEANRADEAEKLLATPVRLTEERTLWAGEDDYDTGHVKGWNANRIEQAALLKKQGFTVEGDE